MFDFRKAVKFSSGVSLSFASLHRKASKYPQDKCSLSSASSSPFAAARPAFLNIRTVRIQGALVLCREPNVHAKAEVEKTFQGFRFVTQKKPGINENFSAHEFAFDNTTITRPSRLKFSPSTRLVSHETNRTKRTSSSLLH
ncbi:hypothetical protein SERLADRAFT_443109 [Serpula lacrymans var. lacrymans S7.9]|uniref:Uncharacterized protein n=1 Tax=Serpula lacrymans var. lacrymans (strain S7.9) TaxID=578457 RepID=F8PBK2_SERL9|nr:uncharacterized protein SERLADRAFT_443109 [Serpula lacrymans var. lacrymans S7.9]EGO19640.1 hypothetical protein SERLADRAFT_443109 [Serpula lacrymans var. lacrymans S7.9]